MTFKEDITSKIITAFGGKANKAFEMLENSILKNDDLNTDRIIRCIIFLAKGNIDDLDKYIKAGTVDPRDVILWAEYEKINDDLEFKRVRDFTMVFEKNENDIKE